MPSKATILIVDDTPAGRQTLEELLISQDYELAFASDGPEALAQAAELTPDLILLDVMMPGMDGFEVCRRLRADSRLAEVPVIIVTALDDRGSRLRGIEAGADDFISKPFDRAELCARVRTITRLNRYRHLLAERARVEKIEEHMRQQDRLAAIGQLAGGIAHDFNNVLMTIVLYTEMLLGESGLPPDLAPDVQSILDEAKEAAHIVRQILDFGRRSPIETCRVDLRAFIQETAEILRHTLPESIRIRLEIEPNEYVIHADPTQLRQVVMNLAVNARDAMPDRGDLRIRLSAVEVRSGEEPPVAGIDCGEWVCMTVSDTGTGIPPEVMSHLFEPFFTTKPRGKGTGLGLAQVYGLIKQHGGHIGVETEVGRGTTFGIYLPAYTARESKNLSEDEDRAAPEGKGETILLAEDEDRVREAGRRILESLGYRVLTSANGRMALEVYRAADRVDLLLTDLVMSKMSGKELIQELRKTDPHLKVVAMTGYALAEDVRTLKEDRNLEVVYKPVNRNALAQAVRRALNRDGKT